MSCGFGASVEIAVRRPATFGLRIVVSDDFESYADTAAMQANWGSSGLGTLATGFGNPGQSALHPGGTVNSWIGSSFSLIPTATESIVLTADIYDDATSQNERITVGLRGGPFPLFEMGHYNSADGHYFLRISGAYGGESWVPIDATLNDPVINAGWNRFQATFTETDLTVTVDLGADGTIDGTYVSTGVASADAFTDLRFGGPSDLSSAGGGFNVDNIRLETVTAIPEPGSAIALAGLAIAGITQRRRRRR